MDDKVVHLNVVPKAAFAETTRTEVVARLEKLLEAAKSGEVAEFFIVWSGPDNHWYDSHSPVQSAPEMIGRIEIAKQKTVRDCLQSSVSASQFDP